MALCTLGYSPFVQSQEVEPAADVPSETAVGKKRDTRPNIVLIYADDVDCETVFGEFPKQTAEKIRFPVIKQMAQEGIRFSNFHVTTPVCGPSRACLYSGQYAHRNQCRVNDSASIRSLGFTGGFDTFDPQNELAFWMKSAGYTTAHVGKYLHEGFNPNHKAGIGWKDIIPPGWDHFEVSLGSRYFDYPSYSKANDVFLKQTKSGCRTDNEIVKATEILDLHLASEDSAKPLLLCWSPIAAHIPGDRSEMRADRHQNMFADAKPPEIEKRLNATVKNSVEEMNNVAVPDEEQIQTRIEAYQDRLCALTALDENIGKLREEFGKRGMLENTVFIFTSDHGFRYFQHRHYGKRLPYDRITRVPFIVSGPGIPKNVDCNELLANIDIAPTLVDVASGKVPESCDGISFASLMRNDPPRRRLERDAILIENWGQVVTQLSVVPATYCSVRTRNEIYTQWATGGREYYDLGKDPEQLDNSYKTLSETKKVELSDKLKQLRKYDAAPTLARVSQKKERICASLSPAMLSGYIESSSGTEKVEIEIRCDSTGEYWNGMTWSDQPKRIRTRLDQAEGVVSRWTCFLDSRNFARQKGNDLSDRKVRLSIIGTDSKNRQTVQEYPSEFQMTFLDPETTVDSVTKNDSLVVTGEASDLRKINMVRVAIKQSQSGLFWDGAKWGKKFHQFDTTVERVKMPTNEVKQYKWALETDFAPQAERITLIARAYNRDGVFDYSPAIKSTFID